MSRVVSEALPHPARVCGLLAPGEFTQRPDRVQDGAALVGADEPGNTAQGQWQRTLL